MEENVDVDAIYSGYLKASEIDKAGTTLCITDFEIKEFEGKNKVVLSFEETAKKLVLNVTRKEAVKTALGTSFVNQWVGKSITVKPGITSFGGKKVACIEVMEETLPF